MVEIGRPVLFGKLPTHGDFIARGIDADAESAWDQWLARQMVTAREALGEGFAHAHELAPAWRFVLGPGAFGKTWQAGALAPSVDAVGRLYVVICGIQDLDEAPARAEGPAVATACEQVIYDAFAEGLDADACHQRLRALAPLEDEFTAEVRGALENDPSPAWWTQGSDTWPAAQLLRYEPGSIFYAPQEEGA